MVGRLDLEGADGEGRAHLEILVLGAGIAFRFGRLLFLFRWVRVSVVLFIGLGVVLVLWLAVVGAVLELVYHRVELLGYEVRLLEGLAALAVEQGHLGGLAHVVGEHVVAALVGGDGAGRLVHHDVGAEAVNLVLGADVGNQFQYVVGY